MWKTWGKHCIYEAEGIRVYQNLLYRFLQFDSPAIQTMINRYFPTHPQLRYVPPLIAPVKVQPGPCLMLGLGGAGIAHALSPFLGNAPLKIVEISQEVIRIAERYFMLKELKNTEVIAEDANIYLQESDQVFPHILVDLFTAQHFPPQCQSAEFFLHAYTLLQEEGILAINLANSQEHWPLFQLIQAQFSKATLVFPIPKSSNMIILAQKSASILPFAAKLRDKKYIKQVDVSKRWGNWSEFQG